MDLEIVTLAERPQPWDVFWDMPTSRPEFMKHDPIGNSYYSCLEEYFLECVPVATAVYVEPNVWVRHATGA